MLARLSPQNAASTFGASIEQALQSLDVRVKRLEEQAGQGALEEAIRGAEARLTRLERERGDQARTLERVEALVASRAQDLRQNVNRSLEVIVDKVRGETESLRAELDDRDTQLRKDFSLELNSMRELRSLVDGISSLEQRVFAELKATKDVAMATALQVGAVEDALCQLRGSLAALPGFLWGLSLQGEAVHRHPIPAHRHQPPSSAGLARAVAVAEASARRLQSPDSESTEPSPRKDKDKQGGDHEQAARHRGGLARAALAEAGGAAARTLSAEARRRRRSAERRGNRDTLAMMRVAGEALMDATDPKWAEEAGFHPPSGERDDDDGGSEGAAAPGGSRPNQQHSVLAMARLAGEALLHAPDKE